jgi:DAACS family dicarboxylate/amino acid:cation (Na+ or H+) symporter
MTGIEPEKALSLKQFLEGLFAVSLRLIEMAMSLAPIGVFALIFATAATLGFGAIAALGNWVGVVLLVLVIQLFGTYSLALKFIAKKSPVTFFRNVREVIVTAFTTSSSNATLPTALRVGEEKLGIPRSINSFVLTVGATANQNGTALFEGITVLFLAQLFGVQLAVADQLTIVGLCILAGIGTAGVPGGAWPMIASILVMVGVPPEAIGLCIGIDRILDMSRTVVNVVGDLTIAECVAAGEPMELSEAMD